MFLYVGITSAAEPPPCQFLVVAGRNPELESAARKVLAETGLAGAVHGFIGNMDALMDAADLVISKPGGLTTAEALVKKLPMIIINPIPGQEAKNTEYLLSQNVAVEAEDLESILSRKAAEDPTPEAMAMSRERHERVRAAMANLTDRQYQCVLLRSQGLKLREIAEMFGISGVTVAEACGRAMEKLGRLKYE